MEQKKIEFYRLRDFSEKLSVTVDFLRGHFKNLFKIAILIAGPVGLIIGILMTGFFSSMAQATRYGPVTNDETTTFIQNMGGNYLLMFVLSIISFSFLTSAIYTYMRHYHEHNETLDVGDTFMLAIKKVPGLILIMFLCGAVSFVGLFLFLIPGIYFAVLFSLSIPAYLFEDIGAMDAIVKPFKLIRSKWWSTFGLLFVCVIIAVVSSYVFAIPYYVLVFAEMFTNLQEKNPDSVLEAYQGWKPAIGMAILSIGSYLTYLIPILALSFQYFNLRERLETPGLKSQIDNFENIS